MASSLLGLQIPPEKVDSAYISYIYGNMGVGDVIYDHYAVSLLLGIATGQHPCKDVAAQKAAASLLNSRISSF